MTASLIGATGKQISYRVETESVYATGVTGSSVVDSMPATTFDLGKPALTFAQSGTGGTLFADKGSLQVTRAEGATSPKVLLFHLGNAVGSQAQSIAPKIVTKLALKAGSSVSVSGTAKVGKTLTAVHGEWDAGSARVTYAYQWYRDGKAISKATGSTYKVTSADVGKRLKAKVVAKASGYLDGQAVTKETAKVTK
ncbi:MAG: hypothetical protein V4737_03520 [Curtobacterium sp.]